MFLDLKKIGFHYVPNDPFLGECWYSNKTYFEKPPATSLLYDYDFTLDANKEYEHPLFIYAVKYGTLINMKNLNKLKVHEASLIDILNFINEGI